MQLEGPELFVWLWLADVAALRWRWQAGLKRGFPEPLEWGIPGQHQRRGRERYSVSVGARGLWVTKKTVHVQEPLAFLLVASVLTK